MKDRLGNLLLQHGLVDDEKLKQASEYQQQQGGKLYSALIKLDLLDEDEFVEFLCRYHGLATVSLEEVDVDPDADKIALRRNGQKIYGHSLPGREQQA